MTRSQLIYYAMPFIVLLAALLQATVVGQLVLGGVKPDLVLILVTLATIIYGGQGGLLWAFIGGIGLDLFSGGPFGLSSLALMGATLLASLGYRILSRFNPLVPLGAISLGTLIYGAIYLGIIAALRTAATLPLLAGLAIPVHNLPLWPTLQQVVVPAMLYNTLIVLLLVPLLNRIPEQQGNELYLRNT